MGIGSPGLRRRLAGCALPLLLSAGAVGVPAAHADGGIVVSSPAVATGTSPPNPAAAVEPTAPGVAPAPMLSSVSATVDAVAATPPGTNATPRPSSVAESARDVVTAAAPAVAPVADEAQAATALLPHTSLSTAPQPSTTASTAAAHRFRSARAHPASAAPRRESAFSRRNSAAFGIAGARTFEMSSLLGTSHAPRAAGPAGRSDGDPLPVPPSPEGPADLGLGGAPTGSSPIF